MVDRVEARARPPREPVSWRLRARSALSGMVQRIPRRRRWARFWREAYASSARTRERGGEGGLLFDPAEQIV
ncbi:MULTISPECIES: hypothetical protein [unclassified Streptomyces]|uniref:hypothetical protein n=1 Tax=unclassified Streptomyces TaxID=2593676 RepID=UPI00131F18CF|nr:MULTISPECIES: hypothetical protein [unclassified Streptomyces]